MATALKITLPKKVESALKAAGYSMEELSNEARRQLAAFFFERKVLTFEQAAHLADMNLWEFITFLGKSGIDVVDYDEEEVLHEIRTSQWLSKSKKS